MISPIKQAKMSVPDQNGLDGMHHQSQQMKHDQHGQQQQQMYHQQQQQHEQHPHPAQQYYGHYDHHQQDYAAPVHHQGRISDIMNCEESAIFFANLAYIPNILDEIFGFF
jgi:hypothetical protein